MRPLRVVYALGKLVPVVDREVAVSVNPEVDARMDSGCGRVWVDFCSWMSSEWLPSKEVYELGIGRRC